MMSRTSCRPAQLAPDAGARYRSDDHRNVRDDRAVASRAPVSRPSRRRQSELLQAARSHGLWTPTKSASASWSSRRISSSSAGRAGTTVIAGYPWFSDWGRDTMIALPGLTLATGRRRDRSDDPAHVRQVRQRRHAAESLSGRGASSRIQHGRRDAVVLRRNRRVPARDRRRRAAGRSLPDTARHRALAPARHALFDSSRSEPTACCARASRAFSSPGWTRRSATGW